MGRKMWQAEVDKMINVFGASIQPSDATVIVDYLVQHYITAPASDPGVAVRPLSAADTAWSEVQCKRAGGRRHSSQREC